MGSMPRRFWSKLEIRCDKAIEPKEVSKEVLQQKVQDMLDKMTEKNDETMD